MIREEGISKQPKLWECSFDLRTGNTDKGKGLDTCGSLIHTRNTNCTAIAGNMNTAFLASGILLTGV